MDKRCATIHLRIERFLSFANACCWSRTNSYGFSDHRVYRVRLTGSVKSASSLLILNRLYITMFPFLYLFIIVRRSGFEPEMPKPRFYRPLRYQFRSPTHINRQGEIRTHIVYHEGQNFTDSLLQPFAYLPLFNNHQSSNNSNNP